MQEHLKITHFLQQQALQYLEVHKVEQLIDFRGKNLHSLFINFNTIWLFV